MDDDFTVFSEAELPVSESDISKPSKDFVVNLITVFLNKFHIDGNLIKQPTEEQLQAVIYNDRELYDEVIKLINLQVAMSGIYDKIFVKDFQIIDITSPSPKKTKKLTQFLANFVLYYRNKLSEIEGSVNNIIHRRDIIDESIRKKYDALEKIDTSRIYRENQSVYNEKVRKEIEKVRERTEKITAEIGEKKKQITLLEHERQKVVQTYGTKKAEALEITNKTAKTQAQVVESPEGLKTQLQELEKQRDSKIKERELKYDSIKEKKKLLERKENILVFVQKEAEKLIQVKKVHVEQKKAKQQLEKIKKEQEEIQDTIFKLKKERDIQKNHCSTSEIDDLNAQIKHRLSPLRDQCMQLTKDRRKLDAQLKEEEEKRRQVLLQMDSVSEAIQNYETETSTFLKECQKLYKQEISEDLEMETIVKNFVKKQS